MFMQRFTASTYHSKAFGLVLLASVAGARFANFAHGQGQNAAKPGVSAADVIAAFETTVGQIQTIQLTYRYDHLAASIEKFREGEWWRDDSRERLRRKWDALLGGSDMRRFLRDTLIDRRTNRVRALHCNRDRDLLPTITILDQQDTSGSDMPLTATTSSLVVHEIFLLRFQLTSNDPERTLVQLSRHCGGATLVGQTKVGGVDCYHLRLQHPGVEGKYVGSSMDFYMDPTNGFFVRSLVKHIVGDNGTSELHIEVKRFHHGKNGVFFPLEVERYVRSDGNVYQPSVARVTQLRLNEPIDDTAFAFVFPRDLFVQKYDQPPGPGASGRRVPVQLIGKDGEVVREFKGTEYREFIENQFQLQRTEDRGWNRVMLGIGLIAAGSLFGIVWAVRRRRRGRRAVSR